MIRLAHPRVDVEQRDALAVDRDLDLLAAASVLPNSTPSGSPCSIMLEDVVAVGREGVHDRDAAARAERRALDVRASATRSAARL